MNIKEAIKVNTVIHCETESEAKRILNMAHELGYKWVDSENYVGDTRWYVEESKTYYYLFKGTYGNYDYIKERNYTIIPSTQIADLEEENSTDWTPAPEDLLAMKQELTITPPSGYEIDEENSTFQKIVFRKIEPKFPTKLEEIDRPWYISGAGEVKYARGRCAQTPNHFTSKESAEEALEFTKLLAFRDAIWEIEGKPENEETDISFRFKTNEGLEHFEKMKKEIIEGNL